MAKHCVNTTFVVSEDRLREFTRWLQEVYIKGIGDTPGLQCTAVMEVLTRIEPDTVSIAVQVETDSEEILAGWHDSQAALLADDLKARFEGHVLQFSTFMRRLL